MNVVQKLVFVDLQAADPGVKLNDDGVPGLTLLRQMAGGLVGAGLVLCVVGAVIGAVMWAVGSSSSNHQASSRGKTGLLVSIGAAVCIGGANALVTWGSGMGAKL